MFKKFVAFSLIGLSAFAAEGYKVINKIKVGGSGGWDYIALDETNRRLYATHSNVVDVIDPDAGKVVGQIPQLHGVHGVAIAADLNKGFISNGQSDSVTAFNLKTLEKMGEPAAGKNPDAICYEPKTKRIFAMNHTGNSATVIDAKTNEVVTTFPLGPAPEFCVVDGAGKVYVNLEGSSEVLEIDAAKPGVTRRVELTPSEGPSGLAIDIKNKKLFAVCGGSKTMAVVDIPTMKVVASAPIGSGTDAAGYDPGTGLAFSSNGEGNLTIVKLVNGKYEAVDTVPTVRSARTLVVDPRLHRIYLPSAEYGPAPDGKDGKKGRAPILPDSFTILVIGK